MMAYIQKILITMLLLLAIADGCKGNNEEACVKMHDDASQTNGSCCQAPGDQPDVRINRGNTEIECRNKQQGKEITWYTYGSKAYGLDVFTSVTSGTKYTAPSSGGIFTCTTETNNSSVTSKFFCNFHKTFIIPPANGTHENKDNTTTYIEGENVTLQCHVNATLTTGSYALLWIATYHNRNMKCLSSVEVIRTLELYNFSKNNLCCPIEGNCQRYNQTHSLHYLDIENITISQTGEYLCIVFFFDDGGYKWKRVNKTFIQVTNGDTESMYVYILATIGGLALVGAILCLVILYIKYKGKQRNVDHSYSNTVPTEYECTPYAVGVGRENKPQVEPNSEYSEVGMGSEAKPIPVYSEVDMKPPVEPSSEYAEVGMDPHTVYSKICKKSNKETEVIQAENDSCTAYSIVELKN
ncbi:uncharacterized protein [Aquarana catesbeiana]|uniref:uncharacterized protein n=1 Tax=Aquarana catesbeiana TaxID=8400 RepID=UPI003CCA5DD3